MLQSDERARLVPDIVTLVSILEACGISIEYLKIGEAIHTEVMKLRLLDKDVMLGTALVDMHGKCSVMEKTQKMFNVFPLILHLGTH